MKTCCVTGHREIAREKIASVRESLRREVENAVADGFTRFITGAADGADTLFAEVVAELKSAGGLTLEAAIPYRGRLNRLRGKPMLTACDAVVVVCENYHGGCFARRNAYMVAESDRVISVYDGRSRGGTFQTMRLARARGKELSIIEI